MKWYSFNYLKSNVENDIKKISNFFYTITLKQFIFYVLLCIFFPFIPAIYIIILIYKNIIIYLWLFLDIIFKDFFKIKNPVYDNIKKSFKYFFYEFFFYVLPVKIFKLFKYFSFGYFFHLFVSLILKIQGLILKLIIFFFSNLPTLFKKLKFKVFNFLVYLRYLLKKIKIFLFFNRGKLQKILFLFYCFFLDSFILLKFIFYILYLYFISFIRYFYFFDYILLILNNSIKINKFNVNKIYKNEYYKLKFIYLFNKFYILDRSEIIDLLKNKVFSIFIYKYKFINKSRFISLLINNYLFLNNIMLIEIKNILIKNKNLKFNFISFRLWRLFKNFCLSYDYMIIYWLFNKLVNKLLIKRYYLNYLLLRSLIMFNNSYKLFKYYLEKLKK